MTKHKIIIVGGGAAGIATASSLRSRDELFNITIIEPSDQHFSQPGWTMVGAGIFTKGQIVRSTESAWPSGIKRIKGAVANFSPDKNTVTLEDESEVFMNFSLWQRASNWTGALLKV